MGTRLYPEVKGEVEDNKVANIILLERCSDVPLGTLKQLEEFENNFVPKIPFDGVNQDTTEGYQKYCARIELPNIDRLYRFILYGWGRLSDEAYDLIESWGMDIYCGSVDDPEKINALLKAMSICLDVNIPCLCWN